MSDDRDEDEEVLGTDRQRYQYERAKGILAVDTDRS